MSKTLTEQLRCLCSTCIMAPQNRNAKEEELRPWCMKCEIRWNAAEEIERLQAELDVVKQNYVHTCESIRNKDQMVEDRDDKIEQLEKENDRLGNRIGELTGHLDWIGWSSEGIAGAKKDEARMKFLAGCASNDGPLIEGFANVLDDYWSFLGDAIRKRIGEENDSPDVEGTDEDKLEAFRAMVDASIAEEEKRKEKWTREQATY